MSSESTHIFGASIIAGEIGSKSGAAFRSFHPATATESIDIFHAATAQDVHRAASAAADAFAELRDDTGRRAALLDAIAIGLLDLGDTLLRSACDETGLTSARITSERDRTVRQLRMFAELVREGSWVEAVIDRGDPSRTPSPKPDIRRMLRPLGPVAVFGASNFPLAYSVAGGDTASALAAGCPVVVKGHSAHPRTGELVADTIQCAIRDLAMHRGSFSFLHAGGTREIDVGLELLSHPCIKAGGFTGSLRAGVALNQIAQSRTPPIPFFAEMGSVNPVVVMPCAMRVKCEEIAEKIAQSAVASVGQMCTCPGLIFISKGENSDRFVNRMIHEVKKVGKQPMLTPRIESMWREGVHAAMKLGARCMTPAPEGPSVLIVSGETFRANDTLRHENFGPSTIIVECADLTEIRECLICITGSLTGSIWCESISADCRTMFEVIESLAGRVVVNAVPTGVEVCDAMVHSGPFPACNRPDSTAVGSFSIRRWCRPVAFQNTPEYLLPAALRDENELAIRRLVNGQQEDPV